MRKGETGRKRESEADREGGERRREGETGRNRGRMGKGEGEIIRETNIERDKARRRENVRGN